MAKMKKSRTATISEVEVDFRVLRFTCYDSSFLASLGKQSKESQWLIEVAGSPKPVEICVSVDKQVLTAPEVSVSCNGERVFPPAVGAAAKGKLKEDLIWRWPFRGLIRGICVPNHFEVRPETTVGERWYQATITEQTVDGVFKATVSVPNGSGGAQRVDYPAVRACNIREAGGQKAPLSVPQCSLVLHVPANDPLHATLFVERGAAGSEGELITHFFARHTPPPPKGLGGARAPDSRIKFEVSKDRRRVKVSTGYATLTHFLSGDVRSVSRETVGKLKKTWVVEVGPFAKHVIELEKTKASSKVVSLTVDGDLLCEASAEDIDSREEWWECAFRLSGQKFLQWEVHNSNGNGVALDTLGEVLQRTVFTHQCMVSFVDNVTDAALYIDGREFRELPDALEHREEQPLECSPEALLGSFGLVVPYKVDGAAPAGLASVPAMGGLGLGPSFLGGLLFCNCCRTDVRTDELTLSSHAAR